MEKCNFCTQRIHDGHYRAKERGLPVRDGDIVTACMQTCPTQAIVFGNTLDPESAMMRARSERGYKVLDAMNFQPSITYLTKVRNRGDEELSANASASAAEGLAGSPSRSPQAGGEARRPRLLNEAEVKS
jgi:molybdopterin-containing oxidoreductase family iron-sulfur binding subunit